MTIFLSNQLMDLRIINGFLIEEKRYHCIVLERFNHMFYIHPCHLFKTTKHRKYFFFPFIFEQEAA